MKKNIILSVLFFTLLSLPLRAQEAAPQNSASEQDAQQPESIESQIKWQPGPMKGQIGKYAEIDVPAGYVYADQTETRRYMELTQNPLSGRELAIVAPQKAAWFVVFEFSDDGYVKDDDKDDVLKNSEKILDSIKRGTEEANKERKEKGWPSMNITGWEVKPFYDQSTNNLEWAIRGDSNGDPILNYNTRLLGRHGVMEASLVIDPKEFQQGLQDFKQVMKGYTYKSGEKYSEYKSGDKIAKYGLAALIAGGAAAAALQTGFLAKLLKGGAKLIVAAVAGIAAFFKKLFGKKDRTQPPSSNPPPSQPTPQG